MEDETTPEGETTPGEGTISPWLAQVKAKELRDFISHMNGVGVSIVQSYPMAEVQSWTIQKVEAETVLAAGENTTLDMAPFITLVCEAEFGEGTVSERVDQVRAKCLLVKANADAWAQLAAYVNGMRARTQTAIEAAVSEDDVYTVISTAATELEHWRSVTSV